MLLWFWFSVSICSKQNVFYGFISFNIKMGEGQSKRIFVIVIKQMSLCNLYLCDQDMVVLQNYTSWKASKKGSTQSSVPNTQALRIVIWKTSKCLCVSHWFPHYSQKFTRSLSMSVTLQGFGESVTSLLSSFPVFFWTVIFLIPGVFTLLMLLSLIP